MTNLEYCNEILSIIGNVSEANDAIYNLAYDAYLKLGGQESQPTLATIYNELKQAIRIWDETGSLSITENGTYTLLGKNITVNVQSGEIQPNDEIWYITTDGLIITPFNSPATIVSNTYDRGKGIIKFNTDITFLKLATFNNCNTLISVSIPNSVTTIDGLIFYNLTNLLSVVLSENLTSMGGSNFNGCSILTSVNIPNGLAKIPQYTFDNCTRLTYIEIPYGVTDIEDAAFQRCSSLTSIKIPNSVINIGTNAFASCTSLTSVTIGNSVTLIDYRAFQSCTSLSNITYTGTVSQWSSITKNAGWKYNVPATVVHCSDGDVNI